MRKRIIKILKNIKLIAPLLIFLFGIIIFFVLVVSAMYAVAGYSVKIPGLILIALFDMAIVIYCLWPLISYDENTRKDEKNDIETEEEQT